MLKKQVKFNAIKEKRKLLIVDDEQVNRELLGFIVKEDFDTLYAEDGLQAMELIRQYKDTLSLILLDLLMPNMDGKEVLSRLKGDSMLAHIPVIVLTSEKAMEAESLRMGALDFIGKPFSAAEVVLARVQKAVELTEDRRIIQATEREELTGLLARDYFYKYAVIYDKFHPDVAMDAIVFDVTHFHLINEIYGRERGDGVLLDIAGYLEELVESTGGMATRLQADTFLFYVPHRELDYEDVAEKMNAHFVALNDINVRVRAGIYQNVDRTIEIERRFDRAMKAANLIREDYSQTVSFYDDEDYQNDIYYEKLIREMKNSLENEEFEVYFQPKYDISGEVPFISSAEALVRWKHPSLGMISPGVFIPLFESNGLIQKLDHFVWSKSAAYIREWKEQLGISLPVSVNVSRIDLFNKDFPAILENIMHSNGLDTGNLYIEITESAYANTLDQLLDMIHQVKAKGFTVEMDDFGSGYSSLNMLSDFPIDILKLDMQFMRDMMKSTKKQEAVRLIIELADLYKMEVIAEGVEEKAQVDKLKSLGCRLIQGYYFSKPLPEPEFRQLLIKEYPRSVIRNSHN